MPKLSKIRQGLPERTKKDNKVKFAEDSYEAKIIRANELIDDEKSLKKRLKTPPRPCT